MSLQLFASGGQIWSFSISPSNEYSGLISFRIDRFDLLAVQRTLKNLLQHLLFVDFLMMAIQRHYFANKSPSSQGYGFSSGHVWL